MKYASREGSAAYGYEGYFKVSSVMVISTMQDASSKRRQKEKNFCGNKSFSHILKEAGQKKEEGSIEGRMIGYNRNGQMYFGSIAQKAYN